MTCGRAATPVFGLSASPRSSVDSFSAWLTYSRTACLVPGARGEAHDVGVLGRHHEEGRAEQRVRARREDGVVDAELLAAERRPRRPRERPIQLRCIVLTCSGQSIVVEVVEQPVGVVGDAEEPLLELADLDLRRRSARSARR